MPAADDPSQPTVSPQGDSPAERKALFRDTWILVCTVIALVAMFAAIVSLGYARRASNGSGGGASTTAGSRTVDVSLVEFAISPATLSVPKGTKVTFKVTNNGTMQHDFKLGSKGTPMLNPGQSATLDFGPITSDGTAICTVPGHAAAGMKMKVTVTSGASAASGGETMNGSPDTGATPKVDPAAKPAAGWQPRDPNAPADTPDTVHNVTWHMVDKVMEVAPGVTQLMWTFAGTVPGPTLRGHIGDTFNVTIVNDTTMGHSIDFHASQTAMDVNMRTIDAGQSLTYTFKADHAGIWMYHCGTPPVLQHIGSGMYGAVIIDPPGLAPVDHEYAMVQSELYFGAQGKEGNYDHMLSGQYDAVVFNGYWNQYVFAPIELNAGQRVRIWVLDVGPNQISSFHVIGTQFDTVYKEGAYLLRPGPDQGGSQALDLAPAQGGFVEFTVPEKGTYALLSHKFNDASRGDLGHLVAN
ncbi:MAG: multicopper oxidase domain-containing protein [Acidimicrobiales bacterium]